MLYGFQASSDLPESGLPVFQRLRGYYPKIDIPADDDRLYTIDSRLALAHDSPVGSYAGYVNTFNYREGLLILISDVRVAARDNSDQELRPDAVLQWGLPGRWISLAVPVDPNMPVLWASDPIGSKWIYFLRVNDGVIFSDNYGAVAMQDNVGQEIDPWALSCAITLGYCIGNETVRPGIRQAPGGCVFEWRDNDFFLHRSHRVSFGGDLARLTPSKKESAVAGCFDEVTESWKEVLPERVSLSLSAGLDSRTALAYLNKHGVDPVLYTFGQAGSRETEGALSIARKIGKETSLFGIPEQSWEVWQSEIRALGATGPVQNCGWSRMWVAMLASKSDAVIHGYLGDALTGKHLPSANQNVTDYVNYWVDWSVDDSWMHWPGLKESIRINMKQKLQAEFREFTDEVSFEFPHQLVMYLDLYTRQRRWVASQANETSTMLMPACFFYHPEIWRVWANLPFNDLRSQSLYLASNRKRYPNLFEADKAAAFKFIARIYRKLARTLAVANSGKANPLVINRGALLSATRDQCLSLLNSCHDRLDPVINVPYVRNRIENINNERPSEGECAKLIRVINAGHLLSIGLDR